MDSVLFTTGIKNKNTVYVNEQLYNLVKSEKL